jgi:DNA-3-methyladenine glycosylase
MSSPRKTAAPPDHPQLHCRRLRRDELPVETVALARYLIGKVLVHDLPAGRISGRIVETEAYPPGDASGHAFGGPTPGTSSLYLEPGHAYVYFIYGMYYLLNVSSEPAGVGAGVLLRALEPLEGIDLMARRRGATRLRELARGPGRLTQALGIDKRFDGLDLCDKGPLWLGAAEIPAGLIGASVRVGITREVHLCDKGPLWLGAAEIPAGLIGASVRVGITREVQRRRRFYERGNAFVSGPKRLRD